MLVFPNAPSGCIQPSGFPTTTYRGIMNIFMFPSSKGGEDMVCPALRQCSELNIFGALLCTSYVLVWGNPVAWFWVVLYTPEHYLSIGKDEIKKLHCKK